jgi:hypothetical protein
MCCRQRQIAAVKGSIRTTARAPTALAKRCTVRMDGVPLPLSMRATTLWVVPMRAPLRSDGLIFNLFAK